MATQANRPHKFHVMISNKKKHVENQKLADRRPQPFETSVKDWVKDWRGRFKARTAKTNPVAGIKK